MEQFSLSLKVVKKLSVIEIKQTFIFIISGNLLTLKSAPTFRAKFLNESKTGGGLSAVSCSAYVAMLGGVDRCIFVTG